MIWRAEVFYLGDEEAVRGEGEEIIGTLGEIMHRLRRDASRILLADLQPHREGK